MLRIVGMSDIVVFLSLSVFLDVDHLCPLAKRGRGHHGIWLDRFRAPVPGSNPDRFLYFGNKYFAVADAACLRRGLNRFNGAFGQRILHDDLEFHLG
jgi:hypothetical protein